MMIEQQAASGPFVGPPMSGDRRSSDVGELESERKEAARLRRHALIREVWHALMLDLCEAPKEVGR